MNCTAYRWLDDNTFRFETTKELPSLSWSHALAGRSFGALVTETGGGYCFRKNARENKMTPWGNDPLAAGGDTTLTVSAGGGQFNPFAANDGFPCTVTYAFGYASWEKTISLPEGGEAVLKTTQFVPPDRMALVSTVEIASSEAFTAAIDCETTPLLGYDDGHLCITEREEGFIRVTNPFNTHYAPQVFIIASAPGINRAVLVMGCARNKPGEALLRELTDWDAAQAALERTRAYWEKLVRPVKIQSGRATLDHYGNGWALYQVVASRLFARTSIYQCGGAYGFRDQLQDVCAALRADPGLARTQIIRACAHQYEEGDVMHWWHPANREPGFSDKGVRTRCSDDLLWLPYAAAEFICRTGDRSILKLKVPYLRSPPLSEGEDDRYERPEITAERETIYDHCLRAFKQVRNRGTGEHGLLLMGAGDWNDGMNMVGHKGHGESVWLTWFAAHTARRFARVCEQTDGAETAKELSEWSHELAASATASWDGEWFFRGTYDDRTLLGSKDSEECRIDSIAQSFSALFPDDVPPERVKKALESAVSQLVDKDTGIIKLFTPAFSGRGSKNPGYIMGYVPGVRENGGQYTHAAVWLAMAFGLTGERERCLDMLEMLLPETHDNAVYKAEPHVLAADVYSHPAHIGRGGWSHYTGAASWFYRVLLDVLEGFDV